MPALLEEPVAETRAHKTFFCYDLETARPDHYYDSWGHMRPKFQAVRET